MPMMAKNELPRELPERNSLHKAARNLREILCGPTKKRMSVWRPTGILPSTALFSSANTDITTRYPIDNPLSNFNLRLADIACAVPTMANALRIAGLSQSDFTCWELHRQRAGEVRDKPDVPPKTGVHCYVFAQGYAGDYSEYEFWSHEDECRRRLNEAESLIERLAKVVNRIIQTVSPEAVLERLYVSDDRTQVVLDGVAMRVSPKSEGTYLHYLRLGGGEWVSGPYIARCEGRVEFNVKRTRKNLFKKYPRLEMVVEVREREGGRIILPLPRSANLI